MMTNELKRQKKSQSKYYDDSWADELVNAGIYIEDCLSWEGDADVPGGSRVLHTPLLNRRSVILDMQEAIDCGDPIPTRIHCIMFDCQVESRLDPRFHNSNNPSLFRYELLIV